MDLQETLLQLDDSDRSVEWHTRASAFLQQHEIPPNPLCHLVAYEYCSGRRPELNDKIENRMRSNDSMDMYYLRDLFEDVIASQQENKSEEHISDLQNLLFKVLEEVSANNSEAEDYGRVLEQQSAALGTNPNINDLKQIANNLLDATHQAITSNNKMQESLKSAEENSLKLKQEVKQLQEENARDPLTGLYNRRALNERMTELIDELYYKPAPLAVCMFDIDHFKAFNDTYGHQIGDQVICLVSKALQEKSRDKDFSARYGGEEFTLLLPDTEMDTALEIASTIHEAVSKLTLIKRSTKEKLPPVTISMGLACYKPDDTQDSILSRADQALYHAKKTGRNRIATETELLSEELLN